MLHRLGSSKKLVRIVAVTSLTVGAFLSLGAADAAAQLNTCIDDVDGVNDVSGQGDVTRFCIDETNLPGSFDTSFSFEALVLELVEGPTLADRIAQGAFLSMKPSR